MREWHSRGVSARQLRFAPTHLEEKEKGRGGWATTKSSRARKQPAQWLSAGATTKRNDESSCQLKRLEIKMFCANTRGLKLLDPKECGAVLAADAVNERAKEIFTLPTAAHFHCEKIPSIRFLIGKTFENGDFGLQCFSSRTKTFENRDLGGSGALEFKGASAISLSRYYHVPPYF